MTNVTMYTYRTLERSTNYITQIIITPRLLGEALCASPAGTAWHVGIRCLDLARVGQGSEDTAPIVVILWRMVGMTRCSLFSVVLFSTMAAQDRRNLSRQRMLIIYFQRLPFEPRCWSDFAKNWI